MTWKKWLSIGLSAVLVAVTVFVLWPRVEIRASNSYVSMGAGIYQDIDLTPPTLDIKFEPSGTHVDNKGNLKIRLDFYPTPTSKSYEQHHVEVVDETSPEFLAGYKGELDKEGNPVDEADYQKWVDGLPKHWVVNPCLCHFITVSPDITVAGLDSIIGTYFTGNVTATIDDIMSRTGTNESAHLISPYMRSKTTMTSAKVSKTNEETLKQAINTQFTDYKIDAGATVGQIEDVKPESIDVGPGATNRSSSSFLSYMSTSYTKVDKANPANATGTLDTVEIWMQENTGANDIWAGTFSASSNDLTCHDSVSLGDVPAGSKQTYTGLSVDVNSGEYLGTCGKAKGTSISSSIEYATSGGSDVWYKGGEYIDPTDTATFSVLSGDVISIYATGTESASASLTNSPDSKAFGTVAENTTYYAKGSAPSNPVVDGECTFTITNDSAGAEDIDIKCSNFTGGVGWTLASSVGENQVKITAYYSGQNPASGIVLTTSDQEFYDGLASSATIKWDFKFETGTFTDGAAKTATITLTAVAED